MENWKKILLRAAGFGAGFALLWVIVACVYAWWSGRPSRPEAWNTSAIVRGGKNELGVQVRGEVFHLRPKCTWKNTTARDYRLDTKGYLMLVNVDNGALDKVDDASWDKDVTIPAGQTVNVAFDIPYNLADYDESAVNLVGLDKLSAFADKRMKRVTDLKFFDTTERYEIDCPNSWMEK